MTFGLSRLLFYMLPKTLDERAKVLSANVGALLVIVAIYIAIAASENLGFTLVALGAAFAVPCQALWYWRDISKLAPSTAPSAVPATTSLPATPRSRGRRFETEPRIADRHERWHALVRYDPDVVAAADELRPFGDKWVEELRRSYFALNEDKQYLPNIVARLLHEAAAERAASWAANFERLLKSKVSTSTLDVLRQAEKAGYSLEIEGEKIVMVKDDFKMYLYSEVDVQRFGSALARSNRA